MEVVQVAKEEDYIQIVLYAKRRNYYITENRKIGLQTIPSLVMNKIIIT